MQHCTVYWPSCLVSARNASHSGNRQTTNADAVTRQEMEARLARLEPHQLTQALETIAIEVERIGENQRYLTKVLAEREAHSPAAIRFAAAPND